MRREAFGTLPDGRDIDVLTLSGGALTVRLLTLGAILQDVRLAGVSHSLTLGADELAPYLGDMCFFGAIVGPVANRIAEATATLDGRTYRFERNENDRTMLHGGRTGTYAQVWSVRDLGPGHAELSLALPDGLGGFPGNREITVRYRIEEPGTLDLQIGATTDAPTFMNLAHHGYWNLDGTPKVEGHRLRIGADHWLPVDEMMIPTGEMCPVDRGPWDFREGAAFRPGPGQRYDNNLCLARDRRPLTPVLELSGQSGTMLRIATTEPGLQLYDGGGLDTAPHAGHGGAPYRPFCGIALEPQVWPDAPNRPEFPSAILRPGETYRQHTRFEFSAGG